MASFGFAPLTHEPSTAVKLAAAGVGGCIAESATFPLDTAKVRLMVGLQLFLEWKYFKHWSEFSRKYNFM